MTGLSARGLRPGQTVQGACGRKSGPAAIGPCGWRFFGTQSVPRHHQRGIKHLGTDGLAGCFNMQVPALQYRL